MEGGGGGLGDGKHMIMLIELSVIAECHLGLRAGSNGGKDKGGKSHKFEQSCD